jgi:hypothetical protein
MALTPEEKQQIIDNLDELDKQEKKKVLSSMNSFLKWLALILYAVYLILTRDPNTTEKLFKFMVMYCL